MPGFMQSVTGYEVKADEQEGIDDDHGRPNRATNRLASDYRHEVDNHHCSSTPCA